MRDDELAHDEAADGPDGVRCRRSRSGGTRFAFWNHKEIALLLTPLFVLPWLAAERPGPAIHPSSRATGLSRVPIVGLAYGPDGRTLATADEWGS